MQTQTINKETAIDNTLFIKMVLDAWNSHCSRFDKLIDSLSDEDIITQTAPGRNSGIYLLGHLVAVSDGMLPLLGFGDKLHPQLEEVFLINPDKTGGEMPSISDLKKYRDEVNEKLSQNMSQLQPADWFAKHTAVSEEAFAKEPHRNKLNIVINRTNHLSYHLGQLAYLVKKIAQ
ncbi:MAG: DinB family protein [Ferruginibacter sp.]